MIPRDDAGANIIVCVGQPYTGYRTTLVRLVHHCNKQWNILRGVSQTNYR